MRQRRKRDLSTAHLTKVQLRSGTLTAFHGALPSSCDLTNGCTDATCAQCYPPPNQRDAEERQWRAVWGAP